MTPKEAFYLADYCLDNTQVREALKAMARQVEELRNDAERYRWLRDSAEACIWYECNWTKYELGIHFDAAIDAARKVK